MHTKQYYRHLSLYPFLKGTTIPYTMPVCRLFVEYIWFQIITNADVYRNIFMLNMPLGYSYHIIIKKSQTAWRRNALLNEAVYPPIRSNNQKKKRIIRLDIKSISITF